MTIEITKNLLEITKTSAGGYNRKQLEILGITWPLKSGWKNELVGSFLEIKDFKRYLLATKNQKAMNYYTTKLGLDDIKVNNVSSFIVKPNKNGKVTKKRKQKSISKIRKQVTQNDKITLYGIDSIIELLNIEKDRFSATERRKFYKVIKENDHENLSFLYKMFQKYCEKKLVLNKDGDIRVDSYTPKKIIKKEQKVYIIRQENSDILKIGIALYPEKRKKDIQVSNPNKLKVSMVIKTYKSASILERFLHKKFKSKRIRGEWFEKIANEEIEELIIDKGYIIKKEE